MTNSREQEQINKFNHDQLTQEYFAILKELIAKKSIFAQEIGLAEVADYLGKIFSQAGAEVFIDDSYKAPFFIAKFKSPNPQAKTIIFYNHYDTVPADADQVWTGDPFSLTTRDGYIYGRGVDDDKGHIIARLTAVRKYLEEEGDLPLNLTFMIEGAEESASTDLEKYLEKHAEKLLPADFLIWEQGIKNVSGQLEITGGNKGIITFDLSVKSASVDIHSKFGGVIESATWYLLKAINSMRDDKGRILIDDIYEQVQRPSPRELELVEQYAIENGDNLSQLYDLKLPVMLEDRRDFLRRYFFEPALTIEGISSGYLGQGVKTIIPSTATAKMEMRLVPGLTPLDVIDKIKRHLLRHGFDQVEVIYTLGEESYRSDMSAEPILRVSNLAKDLYPAGIALLPTAAGTGPMQLIHQALQIPMAAFGLGNANSRDHAGDENISIADYYTHIELVKELIKSYE